GNCWRGGAGASVVRAGAGASGRGRAYKRQDRPVVRGVPGDGRSTGAEGGPLGRLGGPAKALAGWGAGGEEPPSRKGKEPRALGGGGRGFVQRPCKPPRLAARCLFALCAAAYRAIVRVRHEGVAETVLLFGKEVTTPAVLPAVCYRGVRPRQRGGAKLPAQRT